MYLGIHYVIFKVLLLLLQHAITYVEGDKYYGARATINVWEPKIQLSNEFSLSQLWILAGSFDGDLNSIEAGWQVCMESVVKHLPKRKSQPHFNLMPFLDDCAGESRSIWVQ